MLSLTSGNINGSSGALTSLSNFHLQLGSVSAILAGAVGLDKSTVGTVALSGANTYSGNTTITGGGTLKLGASNVIPSGGGKGNVVLTAGVLDLNGFNQTVNGLSGSGTVDDVAGAGTSTLTAGANNATSAFAGTIQNTTGSVALVKTGTGALTLSGTNTYGGGTTISSGTIIVANGSGLGTGTATLNDAGTGTSNTSLLAVGGLNNPGLNPIANNIVVANLGTGASTIGTTGGGTFTDFNGTLTLNRATTLSDGLAGNAERTSFNGAIGGTVGTLTITTTSATGRITFSSANTFTGNVAITGSGTMLQTDPTLDEIPNASNVDVGAGTTWRLLTGNAAVQTETINALTGSATVTLLNPGNGGVGARRAAGASAPP